MDTLELTKSANLISLSTSVATWIYVFEMLVYIILVAKTLLSISEQVKEQKRVRELQAVLTIFEELKGENLIQQRRYIYEHFPESVEGVDRNKLIAHIQKTEAALFAFDRIGYMVYEEYIDPTPIMKNYWPLIWRCWKKSQGLIVWARKQRGEPIYLEYFEHLFEIAESYRISQAYGEPKMLTRSRTIIV